MSETGRGVRAMKPALKIGLLAVIVYLPVFWWGAPHANGPDRAASWGVDDETPLGPLAQVYNIARPQPVQNLGYPLMHSFVVAAAYTPYLLTLRLTGGWSRPGPEFPYGFADPVGALRTLSYIANLVSVLFAAGIVAAAYVAASRLWGNRAALLAAVFTLTTYPMFYYGRTGNVDVPALFFIAAGLAALAAILADGLTTRRGVALGVFVGLALATKETSFGAFIAFPPVIAWLHWRTLAPGQRSSRDFWVPIAAAAGACFLAFGLGSGLFVDPGRYFAHIEFARSRVERLRVADIGHVGSYPFTLAGHWALSVRLFGYLSDAITAVGVLLGLAGAAWVTRRSARRGALALAGLTYLLVLFWAARAGQLRYVMPTAFVLTLFAARAADLLLDTPRLSTRVVGVAAAIWIVGLGAFHGTVLTWEMVDDSRYAAGRWLAAEADSGTLAYFGPSQKLPPLPAGLVARRAGEYRGAVNLLTTTTSAEQVWRAWEEAAPDFVVIMPDHSSAPGAAFSGACPVGVVEGLEAGRLGYTLAAEFRGAELARRLGRPDLDYPTVNPPIRIYELRGRS